MNALDKFLSLVLKAYPMGPPPNRRIVTIGAYPTSSGAGKGRGGQPHNDNAAKTHQRMEAVAQQKPWGTRSPKSGEPDSISTREALPPPTNQFPTIPLNQELMGAWQQALKEGKTSLPQMHEKMWSSYNSLKAIDQVSSLTNPAKTEAMKNQALSDYKSIRTVYDAHIAPSTANPHPNAAKPTLGNNPTNEGLDQARFLAAAGREYGRPNAPEVSINKPDPRSTGLDQARYEAMVNREYPRPNKIAEASIPNTANPPEVGETKAPAWLPQVSNPTDRRLDTSHLRTQDEANNNVPHEHLDAYRNFPNYLKDDYNKAPTNIRNNIVYGWNKNVKR